MQYYPQKDPVIERDPVINKMRLDVFHAMENIVRETFPQELNSNGPEIKFVSFEDALKELAEIKQNKFV